VYVPGAPVQDRVEVSDPLFARLFEEREQVMPDEDGVVVSLTVAEKPYVRERVIVEVPVELPAIFTVVGFALRVKSGRKAVPQMLLSTMPKRKSNSVEARAILIDKLISIRNPEDWS
jgi:hypothetical protein